MNGRLLVQPEVNQRDDANVSYQQQVLGLIDQSLWTVCSFQVTIARYAIVVSADGLLGL